MPRDYKNYINRELSWLAFNSRVLEEAQNERHPLLERLKFLAIYGTNLDEFYMVRVAGLQEMYKLGINAAGIDGMTPAGQLAAIRDYIHAELPLAQATYTSIITMLESEGLVMKHYNDLTPELQKKADDFFFNRLYPVLVPIAIDSTHPFPHLNNLSFGLAVKLTSESGEVKFGLVRIQRVLPRFVEIEPGIFVITYSIVRQHIDHLFFGYELSESIPFRVTRNADMEIEEEEAEDFLEVLEQGIRSRRKGSFVRVQIASEHKENIDLREFLMSHIKIDSGDIYRHDNLPLDSSSLWQIVGDKAFAHLTYKQYMPRTLPPLDPTGDIFEEIDRGDIVFYQPYESFDPVVKFISDAAKSSDTLSIRMTLYRVGKNSPIVKALIAAAEMGTQVTALVELKARFDEENNLHWAKALEQAGAHVIYGITGLKVHAKIATIVRASKDGLKQYVHLSTGNYNAASAKIYTDVGYFTAKPEIAADAIKFFHHLTGSTKNAYLETLSMAPTQIKPKLLELIKAEQAKGEEGRIIAKMNAVVDGDMIDALYAASKAGVKIDLIIRGICCLRPEVKNLSENIRVISIIGKYLEHARIFYFKHAEHQVYFSSADWMTRNLEKRIELLTPAYDAHVSEKLLEILTLQLKDNVNARKLDSQGKYTAVVAQSGEKEFDSQKLLETLTAKLFERLTRENTTKEHKLATKLLTES